MKKTGLLFDERYLRHRTGPYHPESPERLIVILNGLKVAGLLPSLHVFTGRAADTRELEWIHDPRYIERFRAACERGDTTFDSADNQMCPETYEAALVAVGGVLDAVGKVMRGEIDNAFCPIRPPGHHAERAKAMGFCYFNNVAIAARCLQNVWGLERIGIVDFDVHHGNGTQHLFQKDPTVFYYSIHEHPSFAFPGTGREFDYGNDEGYGFTRNSTVLPGEGDAVYRTRIEEELVSDFEAFRPQFILLSTGFDAHEDDDMSDVRLSTEGFSWLGKQVVQLADRFAEGRLVSVLEGGYCLQRLPELAANHVRILLNH
ncbi:MAG: histone deacetylase family protein [Desulfobacterales bacterium]